MKCIKLQRKEKMIQSVDMQQKFQITGLKDFKTRFVPKKRKQEKKSNKHQYRNLCKSPFIKRRIRATVCSKYQQQNQNTGYERFEIQNSFFSFKKKKKKNQEKEVKQTPICQVSQSIKDIKIQSRQTAKKQAMV